MSTPPKRRKPRRVTVAGTGPETADGAEPRLEDVQPETQTAQESKLSERQRWLLEQRPPHY